MIRANSLLQTAYFGGQSDESDTLQADVMRFMAILSLCLMVIFSLVQSIPITPKSVAEDVNSSAAESQESNAELDGLLTQIETVKAELQQLDKLKTDETQRLNKTLRDVELAEGELTRRSSAVTLRINELNQLQLRYGSLSDVVKQLESDHENAQRRVEETKQELLRINLSKEKEAQALSVLEGEKRTRTSELNRLNQQSLTLQRQQQVAEQEREAREERVQEILEKYRQKNLDKVDLKKSVESPKQRSTKTATQSSPKVSTEKVIARPADRKNTGEEGFSLRFASDRALFSQVANGSVVLYARAGSRGWRLSPDGNRMVESALPASFHEMSVSTVPSNLPGLMRRVVSTASDITWGVTLSPRTSLSISRATAGSQGGVLTINTDGSVKLL